MDRYKALLKAVDVDIDRLAKYVMKTHKIPASHLSGIFAMQHILEFLITETHKENDNG